MSGVFEFKGPLGKPMSLDALCIAEPLWAANRMRDGMRQIDRDRLCLAQKDLRITALVGDALRSDERISELEGEGKAEYQRGYAAACDSMVRLSEKRKGGTGMPGDLVGDKARISELEGENRELRGCVEAHAKSVFGLENDALRLEVGRLKGNLADAKETIERAIGISAEHHAEVEKLRLAVDTLQDLLIERDGGSHDEDCRGLHDPSRCRCGHVSVSKYFSEEATTKEPK